MVSAARPRTRTLWLLVAVFATAGLLLLYPPAGPGDGPSTVESPRQTSPAPGKPAGDVASTPRPPPRPVPRAPSSEPSEPAQAPPANVPDPWLAAATGYADAFTAPVADHDEWVAGMAPWVTPHLAEQYDLTDPARRPRGDVDSVETITPGDYSAHVSITYDTGLVLKVRVVNGPGGWQVTYVEPVAGY